jgi:ADP-ribose pyrophosphatase
MPKRVQITRKNLLLDDFFKVEEAQVSYEQVDGSMSPPVRRLKLDRGDSVAALLHHEERDAVVLVHQFKYPTYDKGPGWITEVVAGMIDEGETPDSAIRREILEETGYRADTLQFISSFYVSPGGSSERIFLYYAEISGAGPSETAGGRPEEHEDIHVLELPLDEAFRQLDAGEIIDAKTVIALMWLRDLVTAQS